jgi:translation initiation factor 1A
MPGKKSNQASSDTRKIRYANREDDEMYGIVIENFGGDRMMVKCEDGVIRVGIIRGKIRKRMWVRLGDLVLVTPWEFETKKDEKREKCMIIWRYTGTQANWLKTRGKLNDNLDPDNVEVF